MGQEEHLGLSHAATKAVNRSGEGQRERGWGVRVRGKRGGGKKGKESALGLPVVPEV